MKHKKLQLLFLNDHKNNLIKILNILGSGKKIFNFGTNGSPFQNVISKPEKSFIKPIINTNKKSGSFAGGNPAKSTSSEEEVDFTVIRVMTSHSESTSKATEQPPPLTTRRPPTPGMF